MDNKRQALRLAPSPTGYVHIGSIRNAFYSYLEAKRRKAVYVLRIEDTDKKREVESAFEDMMKVFDWFGLKFDEGPGIGGEFGPYKQSDRLDIYTKYAMELVEKDWAYYCFCSEEDLKKEKDNGLLMYSGKCKSLSKEEVAEKIDQKLPYVIRLKVPKNRILKYHDLVFDDIEFDSNSVDDQVLLKTDGFPTYHLAVVVDDYMMGITLMTRGMEWLSSTPKQLLLYEAFGWDLPEIAHLPVILRADKRKKLGKRDGDVSAADYIKKGYLQEALINYLVLSGWHPSNDQELFTMTELEKVFSIDRLNKAGSAYDIDKLNWFNKEYLKKLDAREVIARFKDVDLSDRISKLKESELEKIVTVEKNRMTVLSDINNIGEYYFSEPKLDLSKIIFKKSTKEVTILALQKVMEKLGSWEKWQNVEDLFELLKQVVEENLGMTNGDVFWPVRYALSGAEQSPSPNELLWVLGKDQSMARIKQAVELLS